MYKGDLKLPKILWSLHGYVGSADWTACQMFMPKRRFNAAYLHFKCEELKTWMTYLFKSHEKERVVLVFFKET